MGNQIAGFGGLHLTLCAKTGLRQLGLGMIDLQQYRLHIRHCLDLLYRFANQNIGLKLDGVAGLVTNLLPQRLKVRVQLHPFVVGDLLPFAVILYTSGKQIALQGINHLMMQRLKLRWQF